MNRNENKPESFADYFMASKQWHQFFEAPFTYIAGRANPRGDGMEWLAAVPMTFIFLALVMPALILGALGFRYALATKLAAGFAAPALIAMRLCGRRSWASSRIRPPPSAALLAYGRTLPSGPVLGQLRPQMAQNSLDSGQVIRPRAC